MAGLKIVGSLTKIGGVVPSTGDALIFDGQTWTVGAADLLKRVVMPVTPPTSGTNATIVHNLDSDWVSVQVFETVSKQQLFTDAVPVDKNTVTIPFSQAPTAGQYTAVITG